MENSQIGSDEARASFAGVLDAVEHSGLQVTVMRYRKPAAVIVPAGSAVLEPAQRAGLAAVFADAIDYRASSDSCTDCHEGYGRCPEHSADLARARRYADLARELGIPNWTDSERGQ